jgi:hypothetical protein
MKPEIFGQMMIIFCNQGGGASYFAPKGRKYKEKSPTAIQGTQSS